jgi:hypothetical protein
MLWARKWLSGDGMKPGCPALLRQSHLIGPGYCKIVGLYHRNIPERHQCPPGASPQAFINAMGPRLQSPARRHEPVRVAVAWDGNSSKITDSCWSVAGQPTHMSPANDRLRARDGRSTLQQRRRPTRTVNVASIASPASVPFIDYNAARPVEDVATVVLITL